MTEPARLLIVDDEDAIIRLLTQFLTSRGYLVCWADRAVTCLAALDVSRCPVGPSRSRCRRDLTLTPAQSEEARHRRHHDDWTR